MIRHSLYGLVLVLLLPVAAEAQEMPKAMKHKNTKWYSMVHVDFHSGQTDAALKLVREHFMAAGEAAGLEPARMLIHQTGEWDVTYIFPMSEGPAGMEWAVSPNNEKWWATMAKREGGIEKAQALLSQYQKHVARSSSQIVRESS